MKRISLVLEILNNDNLIVKYDLNEQISSFIYSLLEKEFPQLHNEKGIKNFCFSNIIFTKSKFEKEGILVTNSKAHLLISSSEKRIIGSIVNSINSDRKVYKIDNIRFKINAVYNDDFLKIDKELNLKTVTPICVIDKNSDCISLLENKELFVEFLKKNMIHKNNFINDNIIIEIDEQSIKQKKILYKEKKLLSFLFNFKVTSSQELIQNSYYKGFGLKNSIGFGFVKIIK